LIEGFCDPRFSLVQEELARNFQERGEVGASVCVMVDGRTVVDLWGGLADRHTGRPWQRDTLTVVWSCTKGATALCAHLLVGRGLLDLDAPVTRYWPEFGQAGKEEITVRMVLTHQAGVPLLSWPLPPGTLYDWGAMTTAIAEQAPFWQPGTRQGYHAHTFGFIIGELVQRITGRPFAQFFRDEIAGPLQLDFHIGLAPEEEVRVAPTIRPDPAPPGETTSRFLRTANSDPEGLQALMVRNNGALPGDQGARAGYAAVLPGQGGITNARGLSGLYNPLACGGALGNVPLVDADVLRQMSVVQSAIGCDAVLLLGLRLGLGFWKSSDNRGSPPGARDGMILSEEAFGHPGAGGSLGFADPAARLAFGYAMNKQGRSVVLNDRGQGLVDAAYRCLGYRSNRSGRWAQ
jgi:CubicO group peptidase (beta-lactamase class C family)